MNGMPGQANQAMVGREPAVHSMIKQLHHEIERMEVQTEILISRIQPVSTMPNPTQTDPTTKPMEAQASIAESLRCLIVRIGKASEYLEDAIRRLEI